MVSYGSVLWHLSIISHYLDFWLLCLSIAFLQSTDQWPLNLAISCGDPLHFVWGWTGTWLNFKKYLNEFILYQRIGIMNEKTRYIFGSKSTLNILWQLHLCRTWYLGPVIKVLICNVPTLGSTPRAAIILSVFYYILHCYTTCYYMYIWQEMQNNILVFAVRSE